VTPRTGSRLAAAAVVLMLLLGQYDVVHLRLQPWPVVAAAQALMWVLVLLGQVSVGWPLLVPAVPVVLGVVAPGTNDETVTQALAVHAAAFVVGRRASDPRLVSLMGVLAVTSVTAISLQNPPLDRTTMTDIVYVSGPSILGLILGRALSSRAAEQAELRELRARRSRELAARATRVLAKERERIARELHDVVTHGTAAVLSQAGAARALMTAGDEPRATALLQEVEETARAALGDMRRLLGVLRDEGEPP